MSSLGLATVLYNCTMSRRVCSGQSVCLLAVPLPPVRQYSATNSYLVGSWFCIRRISLSTGFVVEDDALSDSMHLTRALCKFMLLLLHILTSCQIQFRCTPENNNVNMQVYLKRDLSVYTSAVLTWMCRINVRLNTSALQNDCYIYKMVHD